MRRVGSLRKRGDVWFVRYRVNGARYEESTGTGDERVAKSFLANLRREIREGAWLPPTERAARRRIEDARRELAAAIAAAPLLAPLTLRAYLEGWVERRRAAGVRKAHDEARYFRVHVVDHVTNPEEVRTAGAAPVRLGDMLLGDVKRAHVRDLVRAVSEHVSATTGKPLAARTVLHVYRTLATAYADARDDELVEASPCTLRTRRGELPAKLDQDPHWRSSAVYTREEVETLLSDERIPIDRRVLYGLMLLTGERGSEAAGRRWRDYDPTATPLGRLVVDSQAATPASTRPTKTGEARDVPVHPALAALLAEWRLHGFPMLFGRSPRPDDPIVPSRASLSSSVMLFRSKKTHETLVEDLARVGLRRVPHARHAMRATFLSLLEVDGANLAIARRATHSAPGDVVGGYVRVQWADVCREVAKLRIELRRGAQVIELRRAQAAASTGGTSGGIDDDQAVIGMKKWRGGRDSNRSADGEHSAFSAIDENSTDLTGPENTGCSPTEMQTGEHAPVLGDELERDS
jgi:integrase